MKNIIGAVFPIILPAIFYFHIDIVGELGKIGLESPVHNRVYYIGFIIVDMTLNHTKNSLNNIISTIVLGFGVWMFSQGTIGIFELALLSIDPLVTAGRQFFAG